MSFAPPPPPLPITPIPAPAGSTAEDVDTIISSALLTNLTNSAKSSLLSAANIGTATLSKIETALEFVDTLTELTSYQLDGTLLNSLADGDTSSSLTVSDVGDSTFVRIVILLSEITPSAGAKVIISDASTAYELELDTTTSEKRLEYSNIPAAFVSNFTVENATGVAFPSYGNSIVVVPL